MSSRRTQKVRIGLQKPANDNEMASVVESRDREIERLQSIIKKLQRAQFGRRSERLDPDQLALALEDLDTDLAAAEADQDPAVLACKVSAAAQKR